MFYAKQPMENYRRPIASEKSRWIECWVQWNYWCSMQKNQLNIMGDQLPNQVSLKWGILYSNVSLITFWLVSCNQDIRSLSRREQCCCDCKWFHIFPIGCNNRHRVVCYHEKVVVIECRINKSQQICLPCNKLQLCITCAPITQNQMINW